MKFFSKSASDSRVRDTESIADSHTRGAESNADSNAKASIADSPTKESNADSNAKESIADSPAKDSIALSLTNDANSNSTHRKISNYAIICITFLICVFNPYALYRTDITQFDSTQTCSTLSALFGVFILFSFIAIYALSFIPKRFSKIPAFILSLTLFVGLIYSFILVGDYGAMDHFILQRTPFDDRDAIISQAREFIVVLALSIIFIALALKKLLRIWQITFATLFIVSAINATNIILKRIDSANFTNFTNFTNSHSAPQSPFQNELFSYSKTQKNIVIIVLDMFSGSHTPHILEQFPYFKEQLDGFTLFPNTISTANSTIYTIATLIGGEYYAIYNVNKRKENLANQIDSAFISTANAFANANFSVSLMAFVGSNIKNITQKLNSEVFALDAGSGAFDEFYMRRENLFNKYLASKDKKMDIKLLLNFGLFKYAPKPFHVNIYNDGFWLLDSQSNVMTAIEYAATFYAPTHILSADSIKPTFKFFHSMMTHSPFGMYFHNDKCEFYSNKTAFADYPHSVPRIDSKYAYQHFDAEACALKYLAHYIELLKSAGIYDNTQIFVVSDHGGDGAINIPIDSRPDTLLLFKDFNARGKLKIDNRLMANYDIASIFCENLQNGCPNVGQNILQNYPANREIIHSVAYHWILNKNKSKEWVISRAYRVSGSDIYDAKNWREVK